MSVGIVTGGTVAHGGSPRGVEELTPEATQQVESLERGTSNPGEPCRSWLTPGQITLCGFLIWKEKRKQITSDPPLRGWGGG